MKLLITNPTFAPSLDGPTFIDANTVVEIATDDGHAIVNAGKGLYIDKADAKGRGESRLASEAQVKAAREAMKAAKATPAEA